ncbi:MAG: prepilin peptidase [Candidatus Pacebacteria bacterium]|nr:prepilin peptidase [Candidatus Paceibacterota bacterium]
MLFCSGVVFLFGLIIGSFLNVVVCRLNNFDQAPARKNTPIEGRFLLGGRSFCPRCRHQLSWFDNLPLISFFLLKGRCRYCRQPISWQYPLVELTAAVISVAVLWWQNLYFQLLICQFAEAVKPAICLERMIFFVYTLFIFYCLIAIFASDFVYQTIPDQISYPAILISIFYRLLRPSFRIFLVSGLGGAWLFFLMHWLTKGKGMAIGDVKLALLLGLFLGWPGVGFCLYLAFLTGGLFGLILILTGRKKFGQVVAFGPFLVLAAASVFFAQDYLILFYHRLIGLS